MRSHCVHPLKSAQYRHRAAARDTGPFNDERRHRAGVVGYLKLAAGSLLRGVLAAGSSRDAVGRGRGGGGHLVLVLVDRGIHAFHRLQLLVLRQADQGHALGVAADAADFRATRTHQGAAIGDQQDFIAGAHQHRGHQLAVALGGLDADHALRATALARVVRQRGALAVAVLGGG
ncbi:hypothetical protein G6F35_015031 [Rhizopus arrhizus]|nr:hypothetical protein G6F35_015031 [Rhizopus arrhizus]